MRLIVKPLLMTPTHPFTIARGTSSEVRNLLVTVRHKGLTGYGESIPVAFYKQTEAGIIRVFKSFSKYLSNVSENEYHEILKEFYKRYPKQSAALAGLDLALHDLLGKQLKAPLWKIWGLDRNCGPQTSFTLGLASQDVMIKKVKEASRYPILKVKLGLPGDMDLLKLIRKLEPKKRIRVDANCGWTVKEAIKKTKTLEKLGVEFLEQPIPPGNNRGLKKIKENIGIPLMTDESSRVPEDVPALAGCVDAINIKLTKCGGLERARQMISNARSCGLKIMLGCMLESSLGITAAVQLAPLVDYLDLDGHLLLADDPFKGAILKKNAQLVPPAKPGLGCEPR